MEFVDDGGGGADADHWRVWRRRQGTGQSVGP